jgi:hypothetical protein
VKVQTMSKQLDAYGNPRINKCTIPDSLALDINNFLCAYAHNEDYLISREEAKELSHRLQDSCTGLMGVRKHNT